MLSHKNTHFSIVCILVNEQNKVFQVVLKFRWSVTYKILSKWFVPFVVIKRLGNTDLEYLKTIIFD